MFSETRYAMNGDLRVAYRASRASSSRHRVRPELADVLRDSEGWIVWFQWWFSGLQIGWQLFGFEWVVDPAAVRAGARSAFQDEQHLARFCCAFGGNRSRACVLVAGGRVLVDRSMNHVAVSDAGDQAARSRDRLRRIGDGHRPAGWAMSGNSRCRRVRSGVSGFGAFQVFRCRRGSSLVQSVERPCHIDLL